MVTKPILNPRKLLHSKWTAVQPVGREKHFLVTQVIAPLAEDGPIVDVVLEAVLTKRQRVLAWRTLTETALWRQGWVA